MKSFRKAALIFVLSTGLAALALESRGSSLASGLPAPGFLVESGDNRKLSLDMVKGRVVVLFYESKDVIRKNIELKNELKGLYRSQPAGIQQDIFRLVVIDCSQALWPAIPIWKSKLRESSRKEGFTIYGDWNREMMATYRMKADESNFLIIDKNGIIRYSAVGKINSGQFEKIKNLLFSLVEAG